MTLNPLNESTPLIENVYARWDVYRVRVSTLSQRNRPRGMLDGMLLTALVSLVELPGRALSLDPQLDVSLM